MEHEPGSFTFPFYADPVGRAAFGDSPVKQQATLLLPWVGHANDFATWEWSTVWEQA